MRLSIKRLSIKATNQPDGSPCIINYYTYIVAVIVLVVGELDDAVGALPDVALHLVLIQLHVLARPLLRDGVDALRLLQGFPPNLKYIFPQINSIPAKVDLLC